MGSREPVLTARAVNHHQIILSLNSRAHSSLPFLLAESKAIRLKAGLHIHRSEKLPAAAKDLGCRRAVFSAP